MEGLINRTLLIEGEAGVDLSGDLSWDDLEDLASELDEETVKGSIDLSVDIATMLLAVDNRPVDDRCVLCLL